ncbi:MAG: polymerase sigma-54 factor [Bacteroidetes bacterium]|jgi:RNA polymerase sigma-54 factor|nr:polymerase sigma-54 factor [Bacteroidota bacterium]
MALKQQLQLKQQQKLSPLQMQVIKLTELPLLELEERIKEELEDNPALEEGMEDSFSDDDLQDANEEGSDTTQEDLALGDYLTEDDIPDYRLNDNNHSSYEQREDIPFSVGESLHDYLLEQLGMIELDETDERIAEYIIGNIDKNGYLERPLPAISDDLLFQQNIDTDRYKLTQILKIIHDFEPAGVGAQNLQECLILQLQREEQTQSVQNAITLLRDYFDEFSRKHYDRILKQLNISEDELKDAIDEVISLNPKPGNAWGDSLSVSMNTVIPDFIVEAQNGEVILNMNQKNIPELRISRKYSEMFQGYAENKKGVSNDVKNTMLFVKQKLDSARWFIDAIRQRQETMQRTMEAIIDLQYDFFLTGDEVMLRPMILKDVAELAGYDISTISRVTSNKYVQTNFGIFPLKYFFSESMQNDAGEEISSREVKKILKESIEEEDPKKPLTDDRLVEILKEKGYLIARRTIAKYREQMNIPVARLRKKI